MNKHFSPWDAIPGTNPVTILDLGPEMCRWPIGVETMRFCGEPTSKGSYCGYHHSLSVGGGTESERTAHKVGRTVE